MLRNVILDWSGTLVDDLPIVMEATNAALVRAGRGAMSREQFRAEFRLPVKAFYDRLFPGVPQELMQEAFHRRFQEVHEQVEPLPHAAGFLEFLRQSGCRIFLLTSVPDRYLQPQMARMGWGDYFEGLWTEAMDKRPVILEHSRRLGLAGGDTLMVGDMEHDVDAAREAGCWSCAVLTGYQLAGDLAKAKPDLIVQNLGELQQRLETSGLEMPSGGEPSGEPR